MLKIAHSVVLDPYIKDNISKETLDSWMILYNRGSFVRTSTAYPYIQNKWYGTSVDELLSHYKNQDLDYLIINWFGAYCQDFWNWHNECIQYIEELNRKGLWVLAGQLISKQHQKSDVKYEGHYYPYPISAIINLNEWRKIGSPSWTDDSMKIFHVPNMSEECVHDDYTPLNLFPSGNKQSLIEVENGNSFISKILDSGLSVYNIPLSIRKTIIHTYPENDPVSWDNTMQAYMKMPVLLDQKHYEFMKHALQYRNLRHAPDYSKGVFFLYNTEEVFPKKCKDRCIEALQKVDTIITPCSMFKAFILGSYSNKVENYIHFDIFERNVLWKRIITENWNGEYNNLIEILSELPDNEEFGFWSRVEDNIIEKQFNKLLQYFGTPEKLKTAWLDYQNKNHKYVKANMLFDDKNILKNVVNYNSKVIYTAIGDIPGYMINGLNYGIHNITRHTLNHLDKIKETSDEIYIDIKVPVNDTQIFENYFNTKKILQNSITDKEY